MTYVLLSTCTGKTLQMESAPRFSSARPFWLVQPPRRRIPFSAVALRVLYQYLQGLPTKLQHHGSLSCMLISSRRRRCIASSGLCTVTGSSDRRRTAENISSNGTSRYVSPTVYDYRNAINCDRHAVLFFSLTAIPFSCSLMLYFLNSSFFRRMGNSRSRRNFLPG